MRGPRDEIWFDDRSKLCGRGTAVTVTALLAAAVVVVSNGKAINGLTVDEVPPICATNAEEWQKLLLDACGGIRSLCFMCTPVYHDICVWFPTSLRVLFLHRVGLRCLPPSLARLHQLAQITLSANEISWVPPRSHGAWPKCDYFNLRGNPYIDALLTHHRPTTPDWFREICAHFGRAHLACSRAAVAMLGVLLRRGAPPDVRRLIGRAIMATQYGASKVWALCPLCFGLFGTPRAV